MQTFTDGIQFVIKINKVLYERAKVWEGLYIRSTNILYLLF